MTERVPIATLREAARAASPNALRALAIVLRHFRRFHRQERPRAFSKVKRDGTMVGQRFLPLHSVGIFLPAGGRRLSFLVGLAVPATVAGVRRVVVLAESDPRPDALLCAALVALRIEEVYVGAEGLPPVEMLVGPAIVGSGTERLIVEEPRHTALVVDDSARERMVALDIVAQLQRGERVLAICIGEETARRLASALAERGDHGGFTLDSVDTLDAALARVEALQPTRVHLVTRKAPDAARRVRGATAILVGEATPPVVHDLYAGAGFLVVRSESGRVRPLTVEDFLRRQNIVRYTPRRLRGAARWISELAKGQGWPEASASVLARGKQRDGA